MLSLLLVFLKFNFTPPFGSVSATGVAGPAPPNGVDLALLGSLPAAISMASEKPSPSLSFPTPAAGRRRPFRLGFQYLSHEVRRESFCVRITATYNAFMEIVFSVTQEEDGGF